MLSVAIPYSDLVAYQGQSFRSGYDFIRSKRRVRLNFQEIILTIPEFAFRKDAKLAGPGPIDHLPKVGSVCHKVYFSLDARHTVSGFTPDGVRLGLGRHGWLWRHCGTSDFALITFGVCARNHHVVCLLACMSGPASRSGEAGRVRVQLKNVLRISISSGATRKRIPEEFLFWFRSKTIHIRKRAELLSILEAHRGDGKRFIVRADGKLTAFLELESTTRTLQ